MPFSLVCSMWVNDWLNRWLKTRSHKRFFFSTAFVTRRSKSVRFPILLATRANRTMAYQLNFSEKNGVYGCLSGRFPNGVTTSRLRVVSRSILFRFIFLLICPLFIFFCFKLLFWLSLSRGLRVSSLFCVVCYAKKCEKQLCYNSIICTQTHSSFFGS